MGVSPPGGIFAANRDLVAAKRMGLLAGYCTVAHLFLSLLAISLGGIAMAIAKESRSAGRLGMPPCGLA